MGDDGARDFAPVAPSHRGIRDAVQEFKLRRVAEIPERAEAHEDAIRLRVREPQAEPLRSKQRVALRDDFGCLLFSNQLVVEDVSAYARLGEDDVQGRMVLIRNRTQRQPGRVERCYFFSTKSTTTS